MTNLEKIEHAIRSAIPELMELTEGCVINLRGKNYTIKFVNHGLLVIRTINGYNIKTTENYTIIGHPVTILHLLRWLGEIGYGKLDTDFVLKFLGLDDMQLDYSKPLLRDQSEEVINEIVKLLG